MPPTDIHKSTSSLHLSLSPHPALSHTLKETTVGRPREHCVLCAKLFQPCPTLQPHGLQPTGLLCPWGFSRQGYWSGLPCPPPEDLSDPEIKSHICCVLHWQAGSLPLAPPVKPILTLR